MPQRAKVKRVWRLQEGNILGRPEAERAALAIEQAFGHQASDVA